MKTLSRTQTCNDQTTNEIANNDRKLRTELKIGEWKMGIILIFLHSVDQPLLDMRDYNEGKPSHISGATLMKKLNTGEVGD